MDELDTELADLSPIYTPTFLNILISSLDPKTGMTSINFLDRILMELKTSIRNEDGRILISEIKSKIKELKYLIRALETNCKTKITSKNTPEEELKDEASYFSEIVKMIRKATDRLSIFAYENKCFSTWTEFYEGVMFFYFKTVYVFHEIAGLKKKKNKQINKGFAVKSKPIIESTPSELESKSKSKNKSTSESQSQIKTQTKSESIKTNSEPTRVAVARYENLSIDINDSTQDFNDFENSSSKLIQQCLNEVKNIKKIDEESQFYDNNSYLNTNTLSNNRTKLRYTDEFKLECVELAYSLGNNSKAARSISEKYNIHITEGIIRTWAKKMNRPNKNKSKKIAYKFTDEMRIEAVILAMQIGNNCIAARMISKKHNITVSESAIRNWTKKLYDNPIIQEEMEKNGQNENKDINALCANFIYRRNVHNEEEKELLEWIAIQKENGVSVTKDMVQSKARELIKNDKFKASDGYFTKFKKRHGLKVSNNVIL